MRCPGRVELAIPEIQVCSGFPTTYVETREIACRLAETECRIVRVSWPSTGTLPLAGVMRMAVIMLGR